MKKNWFFLTILLTYFHGLSQDINIDCITTKQANDCYTAIEINPINKLLFNCSPQGFGSQLEIKNNLDKILSTIPNLPHNDVPTGKNESSNLEVSKVGVIHNFSFKMFY